MCLVFVLRTLHLHPEVQFKKYLHRFPKIIKIVDFGYLAKSRIKLYFLFLNWRTGYGAAGGLVPTTKKRGTFSGSAEATQKPSAFFILTLKLSRYALQFSNFVVQKSRRFFQEFIDFFENNFGHEKKEKLDEILTQLNILFQIPLKNILQNFQR